MSIPYRGNTGQSTYFITSSTYQKKSLFQSTHLAGLFLGVLFHYRDQRKYLLHEFVLMPDHFHMLVTPNDTLEKAVQLIKGGFSYRAKKEQDVCGEIWQNSFYDRRVRDLEEYQAFCQYIHQNPVKRWLAGTANDYPYSSAHSGFELDAIPQRLKPAPFLAG